MNSADFITNVGAEYLNDAFGTSSGTSATASTEYFNANYKAFSDIDPAAPAADRSYDAGAIVGLAIAQAGSAEPAAIKDAIRKVLDPNGTVIHAGKDEFAKALQLIKDGKPIKYEGVIGPITFDEYRRHHRPVPALADPERRGHDGRRDVDRRRRRDQGEDRAIACVGAASIRGAASRRRRLIPLRAIEHMPVSAPERIELAPGLEISRIVTGLWQVADMERDGRALDLDAAAAEMARYAEAGFDTFDMADHYGSAEDIAGRLQRSRRGRQGEACRQRRAVDLHQMVPGARPDGRANGPRRRSSAA